MAASIFGVVPSVIGGGILTLAVVALVAVFAPQLRQLDLGRRMVEGPGAAPMPVPIAEQTRAEAAEIERLVSGELGGEGVATQR